MSSTPRVLVALAALLACDTPAESCGDGRRDNGVLCFPAPAVQHFGQGFAPAQLAVLDLDGDGELDLAAVNPARRTLSVTWGGPLARMTSWPVGRALAGLAHGDFDGDGRLDLAAALPADDGVVVLSNRGARRFVQAMHPAGASPRALLGADLDGDGRCELLTANLADGSISVLRRGLADPPVIVGAGPRALAAGDLDGDGALDVAVALADEDAVQVMSGDPLLPRARHPVGFAPRALVLGDLDGDGAADLASADALGGTVTVVLGDGAGGARDTITWPVMAAPSHLEVVRGGGLPPVLGVLSEHTSEVLRLDPRSGVTTTGASARWSAALAVGDLDRDGREELVVGGPTGVGALRTSEGLRLEPDWQAPPIRTHAAVDLDGDGHDELIVARDGSPDLAVWRGPDDVETLERLASGLGWQVDGITGADLDSDGRSDLVAWGRAPGNAGSELAVLMQQPDGRFRAGGPPLLLPGLELRRVQTADVGGDGFTDLVLAAGSWSGAPGEGLVLLAGDGLGGLTPPVLLDARAPDAWAIVDVDGDAVLDLVAGFTDLQTYTRTLELHLDLGLGATPRIVELPGAVFGMAAADLDNDGALDLLYCTGDGIHLLRDLAGAAPPTLVSDERCFTIDLHDLDADGDLDALVQTGESAPTSGAASRRLLALHANDGAGGFTLTSRQMIADEGNNGQVVARGETDLALAFANPRRFEVLRIATGETQLERPLEPLGGALRHEFADLDGDGRLDWFAAADRQLAAGFGTGAATFGPTHHTTLTGLVDPDVTSLALADLADLDGDGASEAIVLGRIENPALPLVAVTVLRAGPDGEFVGETITRLASAAAALSARDLDGDTHVDLLLLDHHDDELLLSRLRGRGDGSFDPLLTQRLAGSGLYYAGLFEIDGDGRPDLLIRTPIGLLVARGQSGGFDEPRSYASALSGFLVRDLDGDRRLDLVTAGWSSLLLMRGTPTGFAAPRLLVDDVPSPGLEVADLDGDGVPELLVTSVRVDADVDLRIGRPLGDGRFAFRRRSIAVPGLPPGSGARVQAHDLDGDAAPDVILSAGGGGFSVVRQLP